jgi:hypothetical protein
MWGLHTRGPARSHADRRRGFTRALIADGRLGKRAWSAAELASTDPHRPDTPGRQELPASHLRHRARLEDVTRKATYQDVLDAPEHMIAEILDGVLYLNRRPWPAALLVQGGIVGQLYAPFELAKEGPGGWILLMEPELHLHDDIVVPNIAGWRCTTMDHVADVPYFEIRPDWICEVLTPPTEAMDRDVKPRIYAREGVENMWFADPRTRTLEVFRWHEGGWSTIATYRDDQRLRAEPFDAIEFDLSHLWRSIRRGADSSAPHDR